MPMPNGWFVRNWNARMRFRASADQFVVYSHEWYGGGVGMGPYGWKHLTQIAGSLGSVPFPVVIEAFGPPDLVEARRRVVVELLLNKGVSDAEQRVVIGYPEAEGYRFNDLPRSRIGGT